MFHNLLEVLQCVNYVQIPLFCRTSHQMWYCEHERFYTKMCEACPNCQLCQICHYVCTESITTIMELESSHSV